MTDRKAKAEPFAGKASWRRPHPEIIRLIRALAVDDAHRDHEAEVAKARSRRNAKDGGAG